jgi:hypothetical protein
MCFGMVDSGFWIVDFGSWILDSGWWLMVKKRIQDKGWRLVKIFLF